APVRCEPCMATLASQGVSSRGPREGKGLEPSPVGRLAYRSLSLTAKTPRAPRCAKDFCFADPGLPWTSSCSSSFVQRVVVFRRSAESRDGFENRFAASYPRRL